MLIRFSGLARFIGPTAKNGLQIFNLHKKNHIATTKNKHIFLGMVVICASNTSVFIIEFYIPKKKHIGTTKNKHIFGGMVICASNTSVFIIEFHAGLKVKIAPFF